MSDYDSLPPAQRLLYDNAEKLDTRIDSLMGQASRVWAFAKEYDRPAAALRNGTIVYALPTDTVYDIVTRYEHFDAEMRAVDVFVRRSADRQVDAHATLTAFFEGN